MRLLTPAQRHKKKQIGAGAKSWHMQVVSRLLSDHAACNAGWWPITPQKNNMDVATWAYWTMWRTGETGPSVSQMPPCTCSPPISKSTMPRHKPSERHLSIGSTGKRVHDN